MKEYTILRRDADWSAIPALTMDQQPHPRQHNITAQAQLCYDDQALYVRLQAAETDIRGEHTGLLDEICEDSCLEFFFCPMEGDSRYFNIEVNPNAAIHIAFGTNRHNSIRQVGKVAPIQPQVEKTTDGWTLTYSIPYRFLQLYFPGFAPKAGDKMRANFYKCGDKTVNPHYLCWNPIDTPNPDYHLSQFFGELIFG